MKCPACASSRVHHSQAKSKRDRLLKRLLPITFYRCHDCNWRRARIHRSRRIWANWALGLIAYAGGVGLVLILIVGILVVILTFLGIPVPFVG